MNNKNFVGGYDNKFVIDQVTGTKVDFDYLNSFILGLEKERFFEAIEYLYTKKDLIEILEQDFDKQEILDAFNLEKKLEVN